MGVRELNTSTDGETVDQGWAPSLGLLPHPQEADSETGFSCNALIWKVSLGNSRGCGQKGSQSKPRSHWEKRGSRDSGEQEWELSQPRSLELLFTSPCWYLLKAGSRTVNAPGMPLLCDSLQHAGVRTGAALSRAQRAYYGFMCTLYGLGCVYIQVDWDVCTYV